MKKITIFVLNLNVGGIERYINNFTKLFHNDFKIEIITTYKPQSETGFVFPDNVEIKYLINDDIKNTSVRSLLKEKKLFKVIKAVLKRLVLTTVASIRNIKEIKRTNADYIITTVSFHHNLVNKYYKGNAIKIATEHNHHNNDQNYIDKLCKSVTNYNYVVHCTDELCQFYKRIIKGPKNIMIPHGIELTDDRVVTNNKNIIYVARFSPEKGPLDFIKVFNEIYKQDSEFTATICGDGYLKSEMLALAKKYDIEKNIEFCGFINGEELKNKYLNSSICVMTSVNEAFGLVLLEAMNYGIPCVAFSDISGAKFVLGEDGILIGNRDCQLMAQEIVNICSDKKLWNVYHKRCLEKIKMFDNKKIKKEWMNTILK